MTTKKAKKKVEPVAVAETPEVLTTFKGFTKELKCIDFQYEVGKSYTQPGKAAVCCEPGSFHSVEMPLDTFTYYSPATSRYAETEVSGPLDRKGDDTKVASLQIAIKAELKLPDLIRRAVEWVLKAAKSNTASAQNECAAATGNSGHAAAMGNYGHAAATGDYGHAAATGNSGHAAATGDSGHAAATGDSGTAFAGFNGKAKAGATGSFAIAWFDESNKRARLIVGTPGEDGIKADTFYRVENGKLAEVV